MAFVHHGLRRDNVEAATAQIVEAGVPPTANPIPARESSGRVPPLELSTPESFVHCMLFIIEYAASKHPRMVRHRKHLNLFFSRLGGLHLLLMLLNAHCNKPLDGREPSWVFAGIRDRVQISERGLRMLIRDAVADGLIVQQRGSRDRRCRKYAVTPTVVEAWEALTETLRNSLPDILDQFDPGALANADYRRWDPDKLVGEQIERMPPSHRHLRRRDASP
jgi:DNA-binding MarR family transcriptional regulator